MRKMMAQQAELAAACGETVEETETSQSDWSEDQVYFITKFLLLKVPKSLSVLQYQISFLFCSKRTSFFEQSL